MRWMLLLVTCLLVGCSENPLRVMTFNVRYGTADDGPNHWSVRQDNLVRTIRDFDPDLLATQETLAMQRDYLAEQFRDYQSWAAGRDDGKDAGEMCAIFYRKDRFQRIDSGHFWLSPTPEKVASVGWDAALTRMASWVKLRERGQPFGKPILFINAHLDHRGAQSRLESVQLIRKKAAELGAGCTVIIAGDFNSSEDEPPYGALSEAYVDAYRTAHPTRDSNELTFHGFHPERVQGSRIDWIFTDRNWRAIAATIDRTTFNGKAPSDHFPVCVTLTPSHEPGR